MWLLREYSEFVILTVCITAVSHWPNTEPISSVAAQITHSLTQWPPRLAQA